MLLFMRAVIQRVQKASVRINKKEERSIKAGFMVLLGADKGDSRQDADWLLGKILQMRIFEDEAGKMNLSLKDIEGEILVISQFTLLASTKKGNRPSFNRAAPPEEAIPLYEYFLSECKNKHLHRVEAGEFGAYMEVSLINDGPVTIQIDSRNRE